MYPRTTLRFLVQRYDKNSTLPKKSAEWIGIRKRSLLGYNYLIFKRIQYFFSVWHLLCEEH